MHLSKAAVDPVADYLSVFILFFVPALLIYLFWMVHIIPEQIGISNERLSNRVGLHLALGGGFEPPPTP